MPTMSLTSFPLALVTLICISSPDVSTADMWEGFLGNNVEGQIITKTTGESGIVCPDSKFKCAKSATCVAGKCQCPDGTHGHPHLACVPNNTYITMVMADPKLLRYDGMSAHLSIPCRSSLTEIESRHDMGKLGGTCKVAIKILTHQVDHGYYLLGYDTQVIITDNAKPSAIARSSIRIFGSGVNGAWHYKEQGKFGTTKNNKPWRAPSSMHYLDTVVRTHYDHEHNLAVVDLKACKVKAIFRGHNKYTDQISGLLVAVEKDPTVDFPQTNNPLSGSPFNVGGVSGLRTEKHLLKLDKVHTLLYNILIQGTPQDFGTAAISCNVAMKQFYHMCYSTQQRVFAVQICGDFYTNSTIYTCLHSDEFGQTSGTYFGMCSLAMCLNDAYLCKEMKRELAEFDCAIPTNLKSLDCDNIRRTRNDRYPPQFALA